MRNRKHDIARRTIIEEYAKYDCSKNDRPVPAFGTWDWSKADAIDSEMDRAHLKTGVPAGYLLWDEVEVVMPDLLECAVHGGIFPGQSRKLGLVCSAELAGWKPDRDRPWCRAIAEGHTLDETAPMLLRPAVSEESPACWYIEDGSGRAVAFVANQHKFDPSRPLAIGYLGCRPDPDSSFMRKKFSELLRK
jgi:hypothetical protein